MFFRRSLLAQFSAISDKPAAQRFLDEHWQLYENGRRYRHDTERELNRGVGMAERARAVHLAHNDGNREKYGDFFIKRYIKHGGRVFSVYAANFDYLASFALPAQLVKESRRAHFDYANRLLLSDERLWERMSDADKIYMRTFNNPPYDTVWHHDVDCTLKLVRCGDHNQPRSNNKYTGKNVVHVGREIWKEIYTDLF